MLWAICLLAAGLLSTGSLASPSGSGLFVVNPDGTGLRTVVDGRVQSFSWSPDGNSIAYVRLLAEDHPANATEVINLRTGTRTRLMNDGYSSPPAWSPDSRRSLMVVSAGGGKPLPVVASPSWGIGRRYEISPRGDQIAYTTSDEDAVYLVKADGTQRKRLPWIDIGGWSPDGRKMLMVAGDGGLWITDSRGKPIRKLATRVSGDGFYIGQPLATWSSRGKIAYMYTDGSCGGPS